jgi:glucose dehydrogenase
MGKRHRPSHVLIIPRGRERARSEEAGFEAKARLLRRMATASGLLFIGATDDQRFHAYESKTGKLLWETKLPANAFANPITYLGRDGKQYVVVTAQETVIAFRLP